MQAIKRLTCVRLATPAFEESMHFYTEGFGLTVASKDAPRNASKDAGQDEDMATFIGAQGGGPVLELVRSDQAALVGMTLALTDASALDDARASLAANGIAIESATASTCVFQDPDGRRIALIADADEPVDTPTADGRPLFVSHIVLNSPDANRLTEFFTDTLGFRIADRYENNLLTFLRADQPQHHCIGVSPATASTLNHFSLDVGSIDALMRSVGRMKKAGHEPIWGPGRHGPGGNVFCYFEDPTGFVAEFTCEVLQISDDDAWVVREWPRVPDTANVWGTGGPTPRAIALMSGQRS